MIYVLIVLAMGLFIPVQTAANSRLRGVVGPAYVSTLISFSVSSIALLVVSTLAGIAIIPTSEQFAAAPWWSWLGGDYRPAHHHLQHLSVQGAGAASGHDYPDVRPTVVQSADRPFRMVWLAGDTFGRQATRWCCLAHRGCDACCRTATTA